MERLKDVYFLGAMIKNIKGIFNKVNEIVDWINNGSPNTNYKVYRAILSQSGTSAPVATILENNLDQTISWQYSGVGDYYTALTSNPAKTSILINNNRIINGSVYFLTSKLISSELYISCFDNTFNLVNEVLDNCTIEIRVYN